MANKVPMTTSHHGASGGRASASSQAVTRALPSSRNGMIGRWRNRNMRASEASAVVDAIASVTRMPLP